MNHKTTWRTLVVVLPVAAALRAAAAADAVTLATDWRAEAEQGGYYQAKAAGIYQRHGLDVTIRQGGPSLNPDQLIAAGAVAFSIGSNGFGPLNLARAGAPAIAVMASFQKDPQIIMAHRAAELHSLADLKDRPILIGQASRVDFWPWLRARYGFTDAQVRPYAFNLAPWLVDPRAAVEGYVGSEPYQAARQGADAQVFLLADDGYPGYGSMVLAQTGLVETRPELVQRFVDATIEGWTAYLHGDRSAGDALIRRENPDMDQALIDYGVTQLRDRGIVEGGDAATLGLGVMTEARWRLFYEAMRAVGVAPAGLDLGQVFTTRFVDRAAAAAGARAR